jgi:hypothetical protein
LVLVGRVEQQARELAVKVVIQHLVQFLLDMAVVALLLLLVEMAVAVEVFFLLAVVAVLVLHIFRLNTMGKDMEE